MPLIAVETPIGQTAGVVGTSFPLQGNQYEFLPFDALVEFAVIIKAKTGSLGGAVAKVQVYSGSDLLAQDIQLDTLAIDRSLEYPEHYQLQDVAGAGERLSVQLQITAVEGTGEDVVQTRVRITPV